MVEEKQSSALSGLASQLRSSSSTSLFSCSASTQAFEQGVTFWPFSDATMHCALEP